MILGILAGFMQPATAQERTYQQLPIREITVFKDGHAFILHEGLLPTNAQGHIVLDTLPQPVLGTFWAYAADPQADLTCVVAGRDTIEVDQDTTTLLDLVKANISAKVMITEQDGTTYEATILRVLKPNPDETVPSAVSPHEHVMLLETEQGTKALTIMQIKHLTFIDDPKVTTHIPAQKDSLTLQLAWATDKPRDKARVGMTYIQKGLRWIPGYRVEINGMGNAHVKLQATLINDLVDIQDVTAHLVIGVPRFVFEQTPDPISLQETVAQLSQHFRRDHRTAYAFNNALMGQCAEMEYAATPVSSPDAPDPQVKGSEKAEDHFVFTVEHVTLKKGQRLVMPLAEYDIPYEDIYTLDVPFAPPLEMHRQFNNNQQLELAKLFHGPKALHVLRLKNTSDYPLTTAPALILKQGRILAQGMMTYTAIHGTCDLEVTMAVDIHIKKSEEQIQTIPNAVTWNNDQYAKIEMSGAITLTNYQDKPVTLEVKRSVLGIVDTASHDGRIHQAGHGYEGWDVNNGLPLWWNWCRWPWWWYHLNSIGLVDWEMTLPPAEEIELTYTWHYFWRP
jgi:hypothetical protein